MDYRVNKFNSSSSKGSSRREISANKTKEIYIENITTGEQKSLKISMNKTITELKREIEKLFKLENNKLSEYSLRVVTNGMRDGKLIQEDNEKLTLYDNHFKSECIVKFGKEKNRGGKNLIII